MNDFWQEQARKHPTIYAILSTALAVGDFFVNGHFIKAAGRWVIRVGGYVAETVLMFAVLWITCASVAPKLVELFISQQLMQYVVWLSLATLALIPEIILASAIVNATGHWLAVIRNWRDIGAWIWAVLFTVPTVMFFILTWITLNTLGANGGNLVTASADTLNMRLDAGWIYGLLELTYAGVKRFLPHASLFSSVPVPVPPTQSTPEELAQSLVPLLVPHFDAMKQSILAEVKQSVPVPQVNYREIARQLVPLLPVPTVDHQQIAQSLVPLMPVPSVPEVDPHEIARAVAPLLRPAFIEARRTIIEEVKAIVPQIAVPVPVPQIEATGTDKASAEPVESSEDDLDRDARLERAYQALLQEGTRPSANLLYVRANCNRKAAQKWLKSRQGGTDDTSVGTDDSNVVPVIGGTAGTDQRDWSHATTEEIPAILELTEVAAN